MGRGCFWVCTLASNSLFLHWQMWCQLGYCAKGEKGRGGRILQRKLQLQKRRIWLIAFLSSFFQSNRGVTIWSAENKRKQRTVFLTPNGNNGGNYGRRYFAPFWAKSKNKKKLSSYLKRVRFFCLFAGFSLTQICQTAVCENGNLITAPIVLRSNPAQLFAGGETEICFSSCGCMLYWGVLHITRATVRQSHSLQPDT